MFCSADCFRAYVESMSRSLIPDSITQHVRLVLPEERGGDPPCYSPILNTSFRSGFECLFIERAHLDWGWRYFYEPHIVKVDDRHLYLPDFYFPEYGVWVEIKGEWRLGSKRKFRLAQEILGKDRLILAPAPYRNWFVKKRFKCAV